MKNRNRVLALALALVLVLCAFVSCSGGTSQTDDPTTDNSTTDKPTTDNPTTDKPTTDNPTTDKPTTDNTDTPSADAGADPSPDEGDPSAPIIPSDDILMGTPSVDGALDEMYEYSYRLTVSGEEHTFHTSSGGTKTGAHGDSATAYYLYDADYLYVCIVVTDDAVYSRGEEWAIENIRDLSWENDAVEARIYYEELGDAKQANQYIFQCDAYGYATTNYLSMCKEPYTVETAITEDGYIVEFALPLSFGKAAGDEIGLTIEIDDLHEEVAPSDTAMGKHNFNAYGSQHPYGNMVTLSDLLAPTK